MQFQKEIFTRWADLDPNFHLRHSVYYDFGAQMRVEALYQLGITPEIMIAQHFGPIIFREECLFRREIRVNDKIFINAKVSKMRADCSRWTIIHEITGDDGSLKAQVTVDGAWLDTQLRKLVNPTPAVITEKMNLFPRTDDFVLEPVPDR